MIKPKIIEVSIDKLIPAEWNYKKDDEKMAIKLKQSILEDKSAGIPAVREIKVKNKIIYEVIDGNHRLTALKELVEGNDEWKNVTVENFGKIKLGKAVLIARRRNLQWFEDDIIKFAELFRDHVLPTTSIEEIQSYMPETIEELKQYEELLDFDWEQFSKSESQEIDIDGEKWIDVKIRLPEKVYIMYENEMERLRGIGETDSDIKAFEYMIVNSANTPAESLE